MSTVDHIGGLRVVIYSNDHRPAHVHVMGNGCEAVFKLNCPAGAIEVRENYGFPGAQLTRIKAALTPKQADLCAAWRDIHGAP